MIAEPGTTQRRAIVTWGLLVLATLLSWWLAGEYEFRASAKAFVGTALILTIAFAKIRFIGREFMELRTAPAALRIIFDLWVVGVWGMLIGLYLLFGAQA